MLLSDHPSRLLVAIPDVPSRLMFFTLSHMSPPSTRPLFHRPLLSCCLHSLPASLMPLCFCPPLSLPALYSKLLSRQARRITEYKREEQMLLPEDIDYHQYVSPGLQVTVCCAPASMYAHPQRAGSKPCPGRPWTG